jgi:Peptidase A4 family
MKIRLCYPILVCSLALASLAPVQSQTPPKAGLALVPTNLPSVWAFAAPPAEFDPLSASPEALQQFGFPPKPDPRQDPDAYQAWAEAVSAPQKRLQSPHLVSTQLYHGPARIIRPLAGAQPPSDVINGPVNNATAVTTDNWSGFIVQDNVRKPFTQGKIHAKWIVPVAQLAFGNPVASPVYSSQWVGLDGDGGFSHDVLQAGTEAGVQLIGQEPFYYAWIEWFPGGELEVDNFPVAPGDVIFVAVWNIPGILNSPSNLGNVSLINETQQRATSLLLVAPRGTALVGNCAEWIVERPSLSDGSLARLTNYVACPFHACKAFGSFNGGALNRSFFPGSTIAPPTTIFAVSMLNNAGGVISVPDLLGLSDLWFRDVGTAFSH